MPRSSTISNRGGIDVRLRQQAAAQETRDLVRVDSVVLGLAAVDGLHRECVAEDEQDALGRADGGQPVPGEHTLGYDDEVLSVRRDDLEERLGRRWHVAMHEYLAGRV
jgi:hypothetical protein